MARQRDPKPGAWRFQVGESPHLLTAYERKEKGNRIYTRVWDGLRYSDRRVLCDPIRTERGAIDREKENDARQLAVERHRELLSGLSPEDRITGPLTIARGFAKRLHPKEGEWATRTSHVRQVMRSRDIIVRILPPDLRWADLKHAHYRKIWRTLAEEYRDTGKGGPVWTERVIATLRATAIWLQVEGLTEPGEGQPASRWNAALEKDWREIVGRPVPAPKKPRYTDEESSALWKALPDADPRLWLAMEIGAELRLGQVVESMRSDVMARGDEPLHAVRVHGKGKKGGAVVVLDDHSRDLLRRMLETGYLSEAEAAYQAETIKDYPLFPGHKMGEKVPATRQRKISFSGLHGMWMDLERLAGVSHVAGRAWYGMRRLQSDKAEDVEPDARVLNSMGGWKHTATREKYQEEGRLDIAEKAASTRRKIRPSSLPKSEAEGQELHPIVTPAEKTGAGEIG